MTQATAKQTAYLLSLLNRAHGAEWKYISQVPNELCPVSKTAQRRLSKADASKWIDQLTGGSRRTRTYRRPARSTSGQSGRCTGCGTTLDRLSAGGWCYDCQP